MNKLFSQHRHRLAAMVRLRMNPQIRPRVNESDIVQEALLLASEKYDDYSKAPELPVYLWLRRLAALKLAEAHVRHLDARKRDVRREVSVQELKVPQANVGVLAGELAESFTSPSQAVMKAELHAIIRKQLDEMDPTDREILVLIHFEQLSTTEAAQVLELTPAGASGRYGRALRRLRAALQLKDGFSDVKRIQ